LEEWSLVPRAAFHGRSPALYAHDLGAVRGAGWHEIELNTKLAKAAGIKVN
jgi:hypothetical protein